MDVFSHRETMFSLTRPCSGGDGYPGLPSPVLLLPGWVTLSE